MRIVEKMSSDHDSEVIAWREKLFDLIEKPSLNPVSSYVANSYS